MCVCVCVCVNAWHNRTLTNQPHTPRNLHNALYRLETEVETLEHILLHTLQGAECQVRDRAQERQRGREEAGVRAWERERERVRLKGGVGFGR